MALPCELKGLGGTVCEGCGSTLTLSVLLSGAGWYLGYWCYRCGPISRETDYFAIRKEAELALARWLLASEKPENLRTAYSVGAAYSADCYICNDPYFARKGLPLCRKCPDCGGHIAADDSVCDSCGYNEHEHYGEG